LLYVTQCLGYMNAELRANVNKASLVVQMVKNPPTMQETLVRFLGQKDPLEKGKATHSSILAWIVPLYSPWGRKELDMTERLSYKHESTGNPFQEI